MPVDTAKVKGRRRLDYRSLEELQADAERLGAGPVKALGNWSPGQIYRHLAVSFTHSIDGADIKFPWYLRLMARIFKKKLIRGPMPPGFKMPPDAAKLIVPGPTSTEEGLTELRAAIARLQREHKRARHPVFGELTQEEWNQLYLKHASLHMSFLVPE
jgi:hypothetical protein